MSDDQSCRILHVDMDAFYASVELRDQPGLRGRPVVVGGLGTRGVVLSATYEARAFGVASAMPMARARRLCPQAIVIAPDHRRYAAISDAVMATFAAVTEHVEPLSLDEAFLDVSGAVRRLGPPTRIAELLRDTIADEQGITCSVGVASTKFVAKLASAVAKPDGLIVVPRDETVSFLHQLPVGAIWGVGDKTEEHLHRLGLRTVADLAHTPLETLQRALGDVAGRNLHDLAWGRDPRAVAPERREKSIGADETFAHDIPNLDKPEASLVHRWVIEGKWKLLLTYDGEVSARYASANPREEKRPQLYDLLADPHENKNLAKQHPDVVARLAAKIEQWWPAKERKVLTKWSD